MAVACGAGSGQHASPGLRGKDDALPKRHKLMLDRTGRFIAAPVAGASRQPPEKTSLGACLALLEQVCGN